jgi:hypothetical protein
VSNGTIVVNEEFEIHRTNRLYLISNFRRVLNVAFFLLGDSSASEFYCRRFGTLPIPSS